MPYVITITRDLRPLEALSRQTRRAVATLDERICFNNTEWREAGFDQPDGNFQFFHPVLVLSTKGTGQDETAEVLWLHSGKISNGHFTLLMDHPGDPTRARAVLVKAGIWPEYWPGPTIPDEGKTIALESGSTIKIENTTWRHIYETIGWMDRYAEWDPAFDDHPEAIKEFNAAQESEKN